MAKRMNSILNWFGRTPYKWLLMKLFYQKLKTKTSGTSALTDQQCFWKKTPLSKPQTTQFNFIFNSLPLSVCWSNMKKLKQFKDFDGCTELKWSWDCVRDNIWRSLVAEKIYMHVFEKCKECSLFVYLKGGGRYIFAGFLIWHCCWVWWSIQFYCGLTVTDFFSTQ